MPKRQDLKSILIIGAGPIIIGQACEFDYSGAQACKALREEGYKVILVNSNPATIMTDPDTADVTYIGHLRVGHDRRRVAVDEDDLVALFAQRLAGLRAGVVELASLADDDRPRADDQDRLEVTALGHSSSPCGLPSAP